MRGAVDTGCRLEPLIVLKGDWEEMGREFARKTGNTGLLSYFLDSPARLARHAAKGKPAWMCRLLEGVLRFGCLWPASWMVRREDRAFLRGVSKELSVVSGELCSSFAAPDVFNLLVSLACRLRGGGVFHQLPQCSSFVVLPPASGDGALYHGRNLDFAGGDHWSFNQRLVLVEPRGGIPFVMVTGEGLYSPGVTAVNREGIAVSVNMLFVQGMRLCRRPLLTTLSRLISTARSVEEAGAVLRKWLPFSGWGVTVSDPVRGECALFEVSPSGLFRVDPEDGLLFSTNTCLSNGMQEIEYAPSSTWAEHNQVRYLRLRELLGSRRGYLDAISCLSVLSDHHDASSGCEQVLGNAVAMAGNVLSVLFDFGNQRLWVSRGRVPPNSLGIYEAYSLDALFRGEAEVVSRIPARGMQGVGKGLASFFRAMRAWDENLDLDGSIRWMRLAAKEAPSEPLFRFILALLLVKSGDYKGASGLLQGLLNERLSPVKVSQVMLWLARVHDLEGGRRDALDWYEKAASVARYQDVVAAAMRGKKSPYSPKDAAGLDLLFLVADWVD